MNELIFIVEEAPEGGYTARALGASIFAEADSREELTTQVRDAVDCHFEETKITEGDSASFRSRRTHLGVRLPRDEVACRLFGK